MTSPARRSALIVVAFPLGDPFEFVAQQDGDIGQTK
jgi:hypothetical protein